MANITNIINNSVIPGDITSKITGSIDSALLILKAIGILIVVYLIFLVIRWIADMLRNRRIKKIYEKVNEIDEKVDTLLERTKGKIKIGSVSKETEGQKKEKKGK